MQKQFTLVLLSLFLISFVSADVISVTPSSFTLDVMPGDVITKNITITTDGDRLVYLNATSEANITLNYSTPLIVEDNKTIQVNFTIPTGIVLGSYDIYLEASTANTETIVTETITTSSGGGGGGSSSRILYVLPNGSVTTIKPLVENTATVIHLNDDDPVTEPAAETETETETETEAEPKTPMSTTEKVIAWIVVLLFVALAGVAFYRKNLFPPEVEEVAYE